LKRNRNHKTKQKKELRCPQQLHKSKNEINKRARGVGSKESTRPRNFGGGEDILAVGKASCKTPRQGHTQGEAGTDEHARGEGGVGRACARGEERFCGSGGWRGGRRSNKKDGNDVDLPKSVA